MRIGLTVCGSTFLLIGIFMVLTFWPLIDYETKDTFVMEEVKGGETKRYVGEITEITELADIYVLELDNGVLEAFTKEKNFELDEKVLVTITFGENASNWDENTYQVQKIPTLGGSLGFVIFILGLILLIAGLVKKKHTMEELFNFSVSPATQSTTHSSIPQDAQSANVSNAKIEQVTCPKCNRVFEVKVLAKPVKISCPECGVEGILN
ncbi:MAG: hypothetical protein JSV56_06520 [Methanomassiliicoccales archaeon]|nr:MAG: hypothetical protein JSV56_06520 [Methanomassiliicoccales archaeon]